MGSVLAAGTYLHWGVASISVANLLIIVMMVVVFVLALLIPFPGGGELPNNDEDVS
jgi:hypothetical protein